MSLQTRLAALVSAVGADIKAHEARIAALEARGGRILGTQRSYGTNGAYAAATSGADLDTTGAALLQIAITPTVPVFWEVNCCVGSVQKTSAAYDYAYALLHLNVADQDGAQDVGAIFTQHSTVDTFGFRAPKHIFRLPAGGPYTCNVRWSASAGTWNYYQDRSWLWLEGKYWAQ